MDNIDEAHASFETRYYLKNTLRLTVRKHFDNDTSHRDRFDAFLDDDLVVAGTRQPLYDGARELIRRGYSPDMFVTMRHDTASYDSFKPMRLGEAAKWTVEEEDKRGLRRRRWKPFKDRRERGAGRLSEATTG